MGSCIHAFLHSVSHFIYLIKLSILPHIPTNIPNKKIFDKQKKEKGHKDDDYDREESKKLIAEDHVEMTGGTDKLLRRPRGTTK